MSTIKTRLKEVMEALGLKPFTPATTCPGITKNMLATLWSSQTNTVTSNILVPFCMTYRQVNCNWLIRGEGKMFLQGEPPESMSKEDIIRQELGTKIVDTIKYIMESYRNENEQSSNNGKYLNTSSKTTTRLST